MLRVWRWAFNAIGWALFVLFLPFWLFFWLSCRLTAKRCPECGSKWRTELQNEWVYESWKCHSCGHCWEARCGW